jgi:hypothetical protein
MEHESIILIIGSVFLLLGLSGSIRIKDSEAKLLKGYKRIASIIIGIILVFLGIYGSKIISSIIENSTKGIEIYEWSGEWDIFWDGNEYSKDKKQHTLNIEIIDDQITGTYYSKPYGRSAKTKLYNIKIKGGKLIGKYKGIYINDNSVYENGEFEFMMFEENEQFIGRYMRTEPNNNQVDGIYHIWTGYRVHK